MPIISYSLWLKLIGVFFYTDLSLAILGIWLFVSYKKGKTKKKDIYRFIIGAVAPILVLEFVYFILTSPL